MESDARSFDVCIVAHVTRDVIKSDGVRRSRPGGVAYYAGLVLHRLGRSVVVVTRMARADRNELLSELDNEGISVVCGESEETTVFNYDYEAGDPDIDH